MRLQLLELLGRKRLLYEWCEERPERDHHSDGTRTDARLRAGSSVPLLETKLFAEM
jgi:hypothetical protein